MMNKTLKLSLAALVAASSVAVFAATETPIAPASATADTNATTTCPRGFEVQDCPYYEQHGAHRRDVVGPRGMAPVGYALNADHFGPGPHHTAHLRPVKGHGMSKVMNTYCPRHNTLLGDCLGDELDKTFKADYDNLQSLKDQLFIKKQILKARVNDGDDASAISKYAKDVNYARKAVRDASYDLKLKLRNYVQAHFDQKAQ